MTMIFSGFGPRKTASDQLPVMKNISEQLAKTGWFLRSGHGIGADQAFESGMPPEQSEIFRAESCNQLTGALYNEMTRIARAHHPVYDQLNGYVQNLMNRNVLILLGSKLDRPSDCGIYWKTPTDLSIDKKGGTNHTLRIARTYGIPMFNIGIAQHREDLNDLISRIESRA